MLSILRSTRSLLPPLLGVALSLAFAACNDGETPLAPGSDDAALDPASELASALPTPGPTPQPSPQPGPSRIIFSSARLGSYDVFKMDQYGGNVVGLTKSAYAGEPAWSRDNKQIAIVRERYDANNKSHTDIWIMNADGSNGHWARSSPFPYNLRYPTWSPDGSRILLTIEQVGKPYLATLTLATGQVKFVTLGGTGIQANYPTYNPSGNKILFVAANGASLQQINLDGTNRIKIASFGKIMACPKYSADGGRVAFQMLDGTNVDVYVWNIAQKTNSRLTTDPGYDGQPTWSPDGSRVAFMSTRTGVAQIYTVGAVGGSQARITKTNTSEMAPAWSF